jgi:hypothetical protein
VVRREEMMESYCGICTSRICEELAKQLEPPRSGLEKKAHEGLMLAECIRGNGHLPGPDYSKNIMAKIPGSGAGQKGYGYYNLGGRILEMAGEIEVKPC